MPKGKHLKKFLVLSLKIGEIFSLLLEHIIPFHSCLILAVTATEVNVIRAEARRFKKKKRRLSLLFEGLLIDIEAKFPNKQTKYFSDYKQITYC